MLTRFVKAVLIYSGAIANYSIKGVLESLEKQKKETMTFAQLEEQNISVVTI